MASKSNIRNVINNLLKRGALVSKDSLMDYVTCVPRSAQRILTAMHKNQEIHIVKWFKHGSRNIPVYMAGAGKDVPSPPPLTNAQRCKRRYKVSPEKYLAKTRAYRIVKRVQEKKIGYKTNPYGVFYRIADKHSDRVRD